MSKNNLKNNEARLQYLNEKHEEIKQDQEAKLVIDFDKAIQESREYISINFLNREYRLPTDIPFNFSTFFMRHCMKKVKGKVIVEIPDDRALEFIERMFGDEFMRALNACKNSKVTTKLVFETLVPPILEQWGYDTNNADSDIIKEYKNQLEKKRRG